MPGVRASISRVDNLESTTSWDTELRVQNVPEIVEYKGGWLAASVWGVWVVEDAMDERTNNRPGRASAEYRVK